MNGVPANYRVRGQKFLTFRLLILGLELQLKYESIRVHFHSNTNIIALKGFFFILFLSNSLLNGFKGNTKILHNQNQNVIFCLLVLKNILRIYCCWCVFPFKLNLIIVDIILSPTNIKFLFIFTDNLYLIQIFYNF